MNEHPRQVLVQLVKQHGRTIAEDARLCKSILNDALRNEHRKEVNILVHAVEANVACDLLTLTTTIPPPVLIGRLVQKLRDEKGTGEIEARWAVESWLLAFELITDPQLVALSGQQNGASEPNTLSIVPEEDEEDCGDGDPELAKSHFTKGLMLTKKGQHQKAIFHYTVAIRLHNKYAKAYLNRGVMYFKSGMIDLAITDYSKAIRLNPSSSLSFNNRGSAYNKQKEYAKAISDFTEAIALDPQSWLAYKNRANVYKITGEFARAVADFSQAILLNPKASFLYNNRGLMKHKLGEYEQAVPDFSEAIRLDGEESAFFQNRGFTFYKQLLYDKAIDDYDKAIALDAENSLALNNLAWLLATGPVPQYRDGAKAVQYAQQTCEMSEWKKCVFIDTLAAGYAECGMFNEATYWQRKALELAPTDRIEDFQNRLERYQAQRPYRTSN